ncbi:mitochondrial phosphate carrier protein [Nannochloropsis gaditana CCMP526]|uniref:mitochondrial phosphate carrier protein n=1 Tax=Nannochloropsis gaditana (strain CCMP526) TaxID=1093141 RepID=UPI00029F59B5|nr:mitochondrial phosphate carrier protein [Nannochloropsis gaditana CCMP526]EKU20742.1 mitochondrial phosphate carrier protein [Nannochloropsis gaditana CCMP526]|eukprot:XP_005855611.1 mitochondrial phosphate carrier protein [Nannochloropsis gaditana CCMP526]
MVPVGETVHSVGRRGGLLGLDCLPPCGPAGSICSELPLLAANSVGGCQPRPEKMSFLRGPRLLHALLIVLLFPGPPAPHPPFRKGASGADGSSDPGTESDALPPPPSVPANARPDAKGQVSSASTSSPFPSQRRPPGKQKLSSTIPILGIALLLTGLAALIPSALLFPDASSASLLASLLARLRPPPGIEPSGGDLYWRIFLAGGVCASISHGWAVPLDVVKTRLQTDPARYQGLGIWGACEKIRREEGPGMLLKGLGATLTGYSIQGSLKYGLYAIFKSVVTRLLPCSSIFVTWVLASMIADCIASTALCPLEATRIRLVADPSFASGTLDGIGHLLREEGCSSIFKGMPAILAKQLPYTIVQLCGFELITRVFYSWEVTARLVHAPGPWQWLVSFGSALITAVVETMREAVQELGLRGLYKGTRARLLHVGMIVTIQLVIYDFVKQLVGLPATGAH